MAFSDTLINLMSTIKKFVYDKTSADAKFVKYNDIPTTTQAGPVKAGNWLSIDDGSTNANDKGKMKCGELTLAQYQTCKGYTFISKTTLENALSGKGYLTSASLNGYAKTTDIPSLAGYAKTTDIPDVSSFITADALTNYALKNEIPDISNLASKDDIPDVSNFITENALNGYAKTSDINSLSQDITSLGRSVNDLADEHADFITTKEMEDDSEFVADSVNCYISIAGIDVDMKSIMSYILANIENADNGAY